jgi:hypothetical protein
MEPRMSSKQSNKRSKMPQVKKMKMSLLLKPKPSSHGCKLKLMLSNHLLMKSRLNGKTEKSSEKEKQVEKPSISKCN